MEIGVICSRLRKIAFNEDTQGVSSNIKFGLPAGDDTNGGLV